jgi:outer membrane lipoprotein-sorting protein
MLHWTQLLLVCSLYAGPEGDMNAVLARMDESAAGFKSMSASIKRLTHTEVIKEDNTETGNIFVKRTGKEIRMLIQVVTPEPKTAVFHDRKAEIYLPKAKEVQEYDFGKQAGLVDQFLLLGIGSSGKELTKNYVTKLTGSETAAGQKTQKLELVPKSTKVLEQLKKVELWITSDGHVAQQKFYLPSGDYWLITYSDLKINPGITDGQVKLQVPKGVHRTFPGK